MVIMEITCVFALNQIPSEHMLPQKHKQYVSSCHWHINWALLKRKWLKARSTSIAAMGPAENCDIYVYHGKDLFPVLPPPFTNTWQGWSGGGGAGGSEARMFSTVPPPWKWMDSAPSAPLSREWAAGVGGDWRPPFHLWIQQTNGLHPHSGFGDTRLNCLSDSFRVNKKQTIPI